MASYGFLHRGFGWTEDGRWGKYCTIARSCLRIGEVARLFKKGNVIADSWCSGDVSTIEMTHELQALPVGATVWTIEDEMVVTVY
jgi:hypothetical protein